MKGASLEGSICEVQNSEKTFLKGELAFSKYCENSKEK